MSKGTNKSINQCYYFPRGYTSGSLFLSQKDRKGLDIKREESSWEDESLQDDHHPSSIATKGPRNKFPAGFHQRLDPPSEFRSQYTKVNRGNASPFLPQETQSFPSKLRSSSAAWGGGLWVFKSCSKKRPPSAGDTVQAGAPLAFSELCNDWSGLKLFTSLEICWAFNPPWADFR